MFEICLEDVKDFAVGSIKMYSDVNARYMAIIADFVLIHRHIPTVKLFAHGGMMITGSYRFDITPADTQNILSKPAALQIEAELVKLTDELLDHALRVGFHMY